MEVVAEVEVLYGKLDNIASKLNPIFQAKEIFNELRTSENRYKIGLHILATSDYSLFGFENRTPVVYLGGRESNPLLKHNHSFKQISKQGTFIPSHEEMGNTIRGGSSVKARYDDLDLTAGKNGLYFTVDPRNINGLNAKQQEIVEHIFGEGDELSSNMEEIIRLDREWVGIRFPTERALKFYLSDKKSLMFVHNCFFSPAVGNNVVFFAYNFDLKSNQHAHMVGIPK